MLLVLPFILLFPTTHPISLLHTTISFPTSTAISFHLQEIKTEKLFFPFLKKKFLIALKSQHVLILLFMQTKQISKEL